MFTILVQVLKKKTKGKWTSALLSLLIIIIIKKKKKQTQHNREVVEEERRKQTEKNKPIVNFPLCNSLFFVLTAQSPDLSPVSLSPSEPKSANFFTLHSHSQSPQHEPSIFYSFLFLNY
jgi:hypothetical protein